MIFMGYVSFREGIGAVYNSIEGNFCTSFKIGRLRSATEDGRSDQKLCAASNEKRIEETAMIPLETAMIPLVCKIPSPGSPRPNKEWSLG